VRVDLPVVPCDVTDGGLEGPAPTPGMTVATIEAPASVTARSTWFGIGSEELVLGPAGWACDARIGADASERVTLTSASDADARIVFEQYPGAPYVSVLELACPLFPAAAGELQSSFGTPCPKETVPGEIVTRPSEQVARFLDPAGVVGVGTGSGGRYPVHGGLVFHDAGDGLKVAFQVSCAMPQEDEALCRYLVFDWVERLGFTAGPP
jgi:hypothetical protein